MSSPAVANGVIYVGVDGGSLYTLNAETGGMILSVSTTYDFDASPVVVNGVIYSAGANQDTGFVRADTLGSDVYLRVEPTPTIVHQGDLLTYAFPVWNLGPDSALDEVLTTQVPVGTTFDYIRISGTPGLGNCTTPPYGGTGQIICHENSYMAKNTTWTVRLTVKVTAPAGKAITESGSVTTETSDPNTANNTATVSMTVQ